MALHRTNPVSTLRLPLTLLGSRISGFRSQTLRAVDLELTNRCNLRCRMCWFYGEAGVGDRYRGAELATDEIVRLIDEIAPYGAAVYLGGAEPLLRRDFFDIVAHIKHRGLRASFTTNGTLLTARKIEKLVAMQVDHVTFSVDGDETLHDRIRGTGSYKRVVWSIQTLCQRRNAAGATRPGISVNIAVTGPLVSRLTSALAAIRDATGDLPDIYRIHHLWYVTPEELTAHQSATRRLLGCGAPGAASHVIPRSQVDEATLLAAELRVARAWPKVTCFPDLSDEEVVAYYTDPDGDRPRCVAPFFQVLVKPNGDVLFCPDGWIDDFVLGNVRQESFEDIWNGERARKFRQVLFAEKSFPACRRCSFMYSGRGR